MANRFYTPPVDPGHGNIGRGIGRGIMGIADGIMRRREEARQAEADQKADFWDRARRAQLGMEGITEGPISEPELRQPNPAFQMPSVDEALFGPETQGPVRSGLMEGMPGMDFNVPEVGFRELEHTPLPGGMAYTPSRDMGRIREEEGATARAQQDELRFQRALQQALMLEEMRQDREINWSSPYTSEGGDAYQVHPRTGEARPIRTPEGATLRGRQPTEPGWSHITTDQGIYRSNARTGENAPTGLQPRPTASGGRDPRATTLRNAARAIRAEFSKNTWGGMANTFRDIGNTARQRHYFDVWKERVSPETLRAALASHGLAEHGFTTADLMAEFERIYFGGDDGE